MIGTLHAKLITLNTDRPEPCTFILFGLSLGGYKINDFPIIKEFPTSKINIERA